MSQPQKYLYEFGSFRLDAGERLLLRDGQSISLTPKAFDLLLVLVEHDGHLIEKEELLKSVWPDTFVEEANLSYTISHVRKALEDNGDGQRFIETVPKRGYRFVANVVRVEADNPLTEEHTRQSLDEETAKASQSFAGAATDPRLSPFITSDVLPTPSPGDRLSESQEALLTASVEQLETDKGPPTSLRSRGNLWLPKRERWMWIAATALAALTAFLAAREIWRNPAPEPLLKNLSILPRGGLSFDRVAISPDGRWLAFTAATDSKVQLWVRALDATQAKVLPGTEGARYPFWSPDSRHLGFFVGRKLKRIEVPDGRPTEVCAVGVGTGGTWSRDGVILFTSLGGAGVSRVSATGGEVTSVIRADLKRLETDYKDPSFLPDGRHFLYFISSGQREIRGVYVASLDARVSQRLLSDDSNAVYASSSSGGGYLLFGRDGALMAQPFDTRELRFTDEAFSVAGQVGRVLGTHNLWNFTVSDNGVLVLDPLPDRQRNQLVWVDRKGGKTNYPDGPQTHNMSMQRLSPDDTRFIESRFDLERGSNDLWLHEAITGNPTRITFDPATDLDAVWSPDGTRIAWCSNRGGQFDLYRRAVSGGGEDELILSRADYPKHPTDWSCDGRFIIYQRPDPKTKGDVWVLPVGPPIGEPFVFLNTEANEGSAVLSPDGRWMAYISDESDQYEVYIRSFPGRDDKRQISIGGGLAPHWRADSRELYYHAADGRLMAVTVRGGPSFEAAKPVPLFAFRAAGSRFLPFYSVTRDGQRFLLSTIVDNDTTTPLTVIVNWNAELKR